MNTNLAKLPPDWAKTLSSLYEVGAADVEVRAALRMTKGLWDSLMQDATDSDFRSIVEFGRMLSHAWWLTQGRINLNKRTFNANLWFMIMKNQHGYSDKTTTTTKEAADMSSDELDQRVEEAMKKYNKVVKRNTVAV